MQPGISITAGGSNTYLAKIVSNSGGSSIVGLQTIDYQYHIRGWLKGINLDANGNPTPATSQGDLFSYKLDYETAGFYDGNIGKQSWNNGTDSRSYTFSYDAASRLKSATYTGVNGENYGLSILQYDKNGNIGGKDPNAFALARYGKTGNSYGLIDNLKYSYNGNRLSGVTDAISGNEDVGDFRDNASNADYTYWNDGSLKSDANKGISQIDYDSYLQRVRQVTFSNGNWVKWFYDGVGTLLKRQLSNGEVWEYVEGFLYRNGQLYQINDDEGRITYNNSSYTYEFEYRDIWGNLRVGFKANGTQLEATQRNDYDITGFELKPLGLENASSRNNWKFQNQERVADFNLDIDFFKFRPSDSRIVRFWQIDPLSSDYPYNSPYVFQENKFGRGVELEGLELGPFPIPLILPVIEEGIAILAATGVGATLIELARQSGGGVSPYSPAVGMAMSTSRLGELTTMLNSSSGKTKGTNSSSTSSSQSSSSATASPENPDKKNKNKNDAEGNFVLYDVKDKDGTVLKTGKANADDIMPTSGQIRRIHTSERKARQAGYPEATAEKTVDLGKTTTGQAKDAEAARVRDYREKGNTLPLNKEKDKRYHNQ